MPGRGPQRLRPLALDERAKSATAQRMAQLAEGLRLDLADPLTGDAEAPADFLERVLALLADPEAEAEDLLLLRGQRRQRSLDLSAEILRDQVVVGRARSLVLQEIPQLRVLADRRLKG